MKLCIFSAKNKKKIKNSCGQSIIHCLNSGILILKYCTVVVDSNPETKKFKHRNNFICNCSIFLHYQRVNHGECWYLSVMLILFLNNWNVPYRTKWPKMSFWNNICDPRYPAGHFPPGHGPLQDSTLLATFLSGVAIRISHSNTQCCGSMTFWCGSGSADPCLWLMGPDPDPPIFILDLQEANRN